MMFDLSRVIRDVVIVLLDGILSIVMIYQFYCANNSKETAKRLKISQSVFTISSSIGFSARLVAALAIHEFNIIYYIFASLAIIMLYLMSLMRLHHSFKDSAFKIKKGYIYSHIIIILFFMLSWLGAWIYDYSTQTRMDLIMSAIAAFIFLLGYINITYRFICNLFELILMQRCTIIGDAGLNVRQKLLIQPIVKQSLLATWTATVIIICYTCYFVIGIVDLNSESHDLTILADWTVALLVIGCSIISTLTFAVNSSCYEMLCSSCHKRCDDSCQKRAVQKLSMESDSGTDTTMTPSSHVSASL